LLKSSPDIKQDQITEIFSNDRKESGQSIKKLKAMKRKEAINNGKYLHRFLLEMESLDKPHCHAEHQHSQAELSAAVGNVMCYVYEFTSDRTVETILASSEIVHSRLYDITNTLRLNVNTTDEIHVKNVGSTIETWMLIG